MKTDMPSINRSLVDDVLPFDLEEEVARLTASEPVLNGGRSARTLIKDGSMRVTLVALGAGSRIPEHRADGPITIHAISGRVAVEAGGESRELTPGRILSLRAGVEHAVASAAGGIFLLTVALS